MTRTDDRDRLFEILLEREGDGPQLIRCAPIHSAEDFRRAHRAFAHQSTADSAPDPYRSLHRLG